MDVSLIITCKNESSNIKRVLQDILDQEFKPLELIILDAGSNDGTIQIIEEYQKSHNFINLIIKEGVGRGEGRNIAISQAKSSIIAVTDAGCFLNKDWLKHLVQPIIKEGYDVSIGNYDAYSTNDFEYFEGLQLVGKKIDTARVSSRSLAFKKEVWAEVGGYEESVDVGEDSLFHWRFMQGNFKVKFSEKAVVSWAMPENTKELFKKLFWYGDGYWQTIKLKEFRKFLYFIIVVYLWAIVTVISLLFSKLYLTFALIFIPVLALLSLGIFNIKETKKINAILYAPYIFVVRNAAFLLGFTFGKVIKEK